MRLSHSVSRCAPSPLGFTLFLLPALILAGFPGLFPGLIADCAGDESFRARQAGQLVREALWSEADGRDERRQELLSQALQTLPNFAPAKWQQGLVQLDEHWVSVDDIAGISRQDKALREYQRIRDTAPASLNGQVALANWCRANGLAEQERAHLSRALDFAPDNVEILSRLGYRQLAGQLVSPSQFERAIEQRRKLQDSIQTWRPHMSDIERGLGQRSFRKRQAAAARLGAIRDADAIPALEDLAGRSGEAAALVVETLRAMPDHRAAIALARIAVWCELPEVRKLAAQRLSSRRVDDFVPILLGAMRSPIESRSVAFRQGAQSGFLNSFVQESQDSRRQFVTRSDSRQASPQLQAVNRQIESINERIGAALNIATDQQLPSDPREWWNWWNQLNEVFVEGEKPTFVSSDRGAAAQLAAFDRERDRERERGQTEELEQQTQAWRQSSSRRRDCLAPGTLVWTNLGAVPVESLQVGDLVLAKDVETGELGFRPVLRTTLRPESTLVRLAVGAETIEASGGHPFWVAGQGWRKARDLEPGMRLHAANGAAEITAVGAGQTVQSHNLIVGEYNNYFVGVGKILSHDNTVRRPTNALVPGLTHQ